MRALRNLDDVIIVLRELAQWKDKLTTSAWDLGQKQIKNLGPAREKGDAVTFEQLPVSTQQEIVHNDQYYTIVFSFDGTGLLVTDPIAPFVVGKGREGIPTEVILMADTPPSGGDLLCNFQLRTRDALGGGLTNTLLLFSPLAFTSTDDRAVRTSTFITTLPRLQYLSEIRPVFSDINGAGTITVQLVVKRILP